MKNAVSNPIAATVEKLTDRTFDKVVDAIYSIVDEVWFDQTGPNGIRAVKGGGHRPATNEECANWAIELFASTTLDVRNNIPRAAAKWLREQSTILAQAADAVEAIEDCRDLRQIRAIVSGNEGTIL